VEWREFGLWGGGGIIGPGRVVLVLCYMAVAGVGFGDVSLGIGRGRAGGVCGRCAFFRGGFCITCREGNVGFCFDIRCAP